MNCRFSIQDDAWVCENPGCGVAIPVAVAATHPISVCREITCTLFGDATGSFALVQCETCQGNVRLKYPTHVCRKFGECLPQIAHENNSGVKGCLDCSHAQGKSARGA
jgi:hypothetical protein